MLSQAQVIGRPRMKTWDDYEQSCLASFGGGHRTDGHLEAFQHGMSTVFNLLRHEFPPAEQCKAASAMLESLDGILDLPMDDAGDRIIPAGFLDKARAAIELATSPPSAPASAGTTTIG